MTNFSETKTSESSHVEHRDSSSDIDSDMEDTKKKIKVRRPTKEEPSKLKPKVQPKKIVKKESSDSEDSDVQIKKPTIEIKRAKKEAEPVDAKKKAKEDSDDQAKPKRKRSPSEVNNARTKKSKLNTSFLKEENSLDYILLHSTPNLRLFKIKDEHCETIKRDMLDAVQNLTLVDAHISENGFAELKDRFIQIVELEMIACDISDANLQVMFDFLTHLKELTISSPVGLNGEIIANYVARSRHLSSITLINLPIVNLSDIFDGLALNRTVKVVNVHTGDVNLAEKVRLLKLYNPSLTVNWVNHSNNKTANSF